MKMSRFWPAIPGLAILPGFLIILFGGDACKLLILQEPVLGEFPNWELLASGRESAKRLLAQHLGSKMITKIADEPIYASSPRPIYR